MARLFMLLITADDWHLKEEEEEEEEDM